VGQWVSQTQARRVSRQSWCASGLKRPQLLIDPARIRGTISWASVKQGARRPKWPIYKRKHCHRQPGLAQHTRRFHEVPPQLLYPQRGRPRRASYWPSFIYVPSLIWQGRPYVPRLRFSAFPAAQKGLQGPYGDGYYVVSAVGWDWGWVARALLGDQSRGAENGRARALDMVVIVPESDSGPAPRCPTHGIA
jgi:hypothetical protein